MFNRKELYMTLFSNVTIRYRILNTSVNKGELLLMKSRDLKSLSLSSNPIFFTNFLIKTFKKAVT